MVSSLSGRARLSANFMAPFAAGSLNADFSGHMKCHPRPSIRSSRAAPKPKGGVVTMMNQKRIYPYINFSGTTKPIAKFQGQATDIELARKEVKNVMAELVNLLAKQVGKSPEEVEADIRCPKYFSPSKAVEYGIIDMVQYNERSTEVRGVVSDLKKAQLI